MKKYKNKCTKNSKQNQTENRKKFNKELLIEQVRCHECLYDTTCQNYSNQYSCGNAWEDIARQLGDNITVEDAKQAWYSLRRAYTNNRNKNLKSSSAAGETVGGTYKWAKQMAFIKPFLKSRGTQRNLSDENEESEDESSDESQIKQELDTDSDIDIGDSIKSETIFVASSAIAEPKKSTQKTKISSVEPSSNKRCKLDDELEKFLDKEKRPEENIQDKIEKHPIDQFFGSMSSITKTLPKAQQVQILYEVGLLVLKANLDSNKADLQDPL